MVHFWIHNACDHNQTSQQCQRTQPQMGLFLTFWIFHRKEFFYGFFLQNVLKNIDKSPNKLHYMC